MPQPSFKGRTVNFKGYLCSAPWCLCIGAGVSKGLIPDWNDLAKRILRKSFNLQLRDHQFSSLRALTDWGLDSWIQTSLNKYVHEGKSLEDFYQLLEETLYEDLLTSAKQLGFETVLRKILSNPLRIKQNELLDACRYFEDNYPDSTLVLLAKSLLKMCKTKKRRLPSAIISLNADTLLHTVFTIFHLRDFNRQRTDYLVPGQIFARVFRPLDSGDDKIPFYHLHGCLLPTTKKRKDSRERLVFPESSYTDLAGNVFSWAQNTFLHYAQTHRVAFLGHSLSDPNIRRWLAWSSKNRVVDLKSRFGIDHFPMPHVWFAKRPKDLDQVWILEDSLWHLGTRICWLSDWQKLVPALENLVAL